MATTLKRTELYELIWSKPRTALAKEFGISDVAIGKHCVRAHIPGPPPGYWAKATSGRPSLRPALPIRMPGQLDEVTFGGIDTRYYWRDAEDLSKPIFPPVFAEDIELQVKMAMKAIGRIGASKDLSDPHPSVAKLLAAEASRRERHQASPALDFYKPHFDAPHHQRQLRIFNSIAHAMGRIQCGLLVYSRDEWFKGHGTLHLLGLRIDFCGATMELDILEPSDPQTPRKDKPIATTLHVGVKGGNPGPQQWTDEPGNRLERQLDVIVRCLLHRAELTLRANAQWRFESRVERRTEMLKEIEEEKREKERQCLEAIAQHQAKVRKDILDLAGQRRTAADIREMIAILDRHPDVASVDISLFNRWKTEAAKVADSLDPMKRPLVELLATYAAPSKA